MLWQNVDARTKLGLVLDAVVANGKHMPGLARLDCVEMVAFCDIEGPENRR